MEFIMVTKTLEKFLKEKRGLSKKDIELFMSKDLSSLPLFNLKDLKKGAKIVKDAIKQNKKVAIYGDYDVDGTTASSLLYLYLKDKIADIEVFQPDRFKHGYGLNKDLLTEIKNKGFDLIITVDLGITNCEEVDFVKNKLNMDIIITDHHHDIRESIPKADAVINPNRRDEKNESLKALAGVGVAYALTVATSKELKIKIDTSLLQFVAIGTIADLVPINYLNAILVRNGLSQIEESSKYPGIKVFFSESDFDTDVIPSTKVAFNIGPIINSAGRLFHAKKATDLLTATSFEKAEKLLLELKSNNSERRHVQEETLLEAKKQARKNIKNGDLINIIYNKNWHEGVIGIVASQIVEEFKLPTIVLTNSKEKNILKGSARSAGKLNLLELLEENHSLFEKFGGHKAAAGLSIKNDQLDKLKNELNDSLKKIEESERTARIIADMSIKLEEITFATVKEFESLEPFSTKNERPIFKLENAKVVNYDIINGKHVKWHFGFENSRKTVKGITFNYLDRDEFIHPEKLDNVNAFVELGLNYYKGRQYVQLMVKEIDEDSKEKNLNTL
jgi:single-stranded-DNA-specific exonuclease